MSNNKSFDIIQNTLNSKGYKSMQETLINTMKAIYNNDDTLKKKYKYIFVNNKPFYKIKIICFVHTNGKLARQKKNNKTCLNLTFYIMQMIQKTDLKLNKT